MEEDKLDTAPKWIDKEVIPDKVYCFVCGKRHFPDEDTFFTFHGNVTVGLYGGIIGNNFDDNGKLCRLDFICRDSYCLNEFLSKYTTINKELEKIKPYGIPYNRARNMMKVSYTDRTSDQHDPDNNVPDDISQESLDLLGADDYDMYGDDD